jgi:hypothetical protein
LAPQPGDVISFDGPNGGLVGVVARSGVNSSATAGSG